MKCFYHPDRDAVAMCKSCNRGLCPDCTSDVPPGVACRGKCEAEVAAVNLVIERSKRACQNVAAAHRRNAMAFLLAGLLFTGLGIFPVLVSHDYGAFFFMVPFGVLFLIWSWLSYRSGK